MKSKLLERTETPVTSALLALWERPDSHTRFRFALWAMHRAQYVIGIGVMS